MCVVCGGYDGVFVVFLKLFFVLFVSVWMGLSECVVCWYV